MDGRWAHSNDPGDPPRRIARDRNSRWIALHRVTGREHNCNGSDRNAKEHVTTFERVIDAMQRNEDEQSRHQEQHQDPEPWMLGGAVDRVSHRDHGLGC